MVETFNLKLSEGSHPYQIIPSKRAKYIRIKLSRKGNLTVTLPTSAKLKHAHDFVHSKRYWIEKNLKNTSLSETDVLPTTLELRLLGEVWSIVYENNNVEKLSLKENENFTLVIRGGENQIKDIEQVTTVLNQWCRKKAKKIFNSMLQQQAELFGFHYQRLSIRAQKTCWGSCSHQKNINLNSKLLFMPEKVVRYVMIHELCHTIEMNHSSRFWALVEECDPEYKTHKDQLKILGKRVVL